MTSRVADGLLFVQREQFSGGVEGLREGVVVGGDGGGGGGGCCVQAEITEGNGLQIAQFEGRGEEPLRGGGGLRHSSCWGSTNGQLLPCVWAELER